MFLFTVDPYCWKYPANHPTYSAYSLSAHQDDHWAREAFSSSHQLPEDSITPIQKIRSVPYFFIECGVCFFLPLSHGDRIAVPALYKRLIIDCWIVISSPPIAITASTWYIWLIFDRYLVVLPPPFMNASDDINNTLGAAFLTFVGGCVYVSIDAFLVHRNSTTSLQSLRDNPFSSLPVLQDMPRR